MLLEARRLALDKNGPFAVCHHEDRGGWHVIRLDAVLLLYDDRRILEIVHPHICGLKAVRCRHTNEGTQL